MPVTRSKTASLRQELSQVAADSSKKSRRGRKRKEIEVSTVPQKTTEKSNTRKKACIDRDVEIRAPRRLNRRRVEEDLDAEIAPADQSFINENAFMGERGRAKAQNDNRKIKGLKHLSVTTEKLTDKLSQRNDRNWMCDVEDDRFSEDEDQGEETDDERAGDKENVQSEADCNEEHESQEGQIGSPEIGNLENITRIAIISVDMKYIEPEPEGVDPITIHFDCSKVNPLIRDMNKQLWTAQSGKWPLGLLRKDDNDRINPRWAAREAEFSEDESCRRLFHKAVEFGQFCRVLPRDWAGQIQFMRQDSKKIKEILTSTLSLAQIVSARALDHGKVETLTKAAPARKPRRETDSQKSKIANSYESLIKSIRSRLIPLLVLVLKEALLLGGTSTKSKSLEMNDHDRGILMPCTLQLALHIVECIYQLHAVLQRYFAGIKEDNKAGPMAATGQTPQQLPKNGHKMLQDFNHNLSTLKRHLQKTMEQLESSAEARRRDQENRKVQRQNEKEKQMRLFIESTQVPIVENRTGRDRGLQDVYFQRHHWFMEEDERILDVIRRVCTPDVKVLASQLPGRTVAEVYQRVKDLRARIRIKIEKKGYRPPKWCYERA